MKEYVIGFQHVGIPTKDMEASTKFYEAIGFDVMYETIDESNGAKVKFFKQKDLVFEVYESTDVTMTTGSIDHISIDVTDVEKVYKEINKMGMNNLNDEIHFLPFFEKGVRYFIIEGPNKEKIEFNQYV